MTLMLRGPLVPGVQTCPGTQAEGSGVAGGERNYQGQGLEHQVGFEAQGSRPGAG